MELAKLFQPIDREIKKATLSIAASALQTGEKHGLFNRFGDRGGDARRWLMAMARLDEQSLRATLAQDIRLVDEDTTASLSILDGPQAPGQSSVDSAK